MANIYGTEEGTAKVSLRGRGWKQVAVAFKTVLLACNINSSKLRQHLHPARPSSSFAKRSRSIVRCEGETKVGVTATEPTYFDVCVHEAACGFLGSFLPGQSRCESDSVSPAAEPFAAPTRRRPRLQVGQQETTGDRIRCLWPRSTSCLFVEVYSAEFLAYSSCDTSCKQT